MPIGIIIHISLNWSVDDRSMNVKEVSPIQVANDLIDGKMLYLYVCIFMAAVRSL